MSAGSQVVSLAHNLVLSRFGLLLHTAETRPIECLLILLSLPESRSADALVLRGLDQIRPEHGLVRLILSLDDIFEAKNRVVILIQQLRVRGAPPGSTVLFRSSYSK